MPAVKETKKTGLLERMLNWIEKVGNKLPDPVSIFGILCILVLILSALLAGRDGASAVHPSSGEVVSIINLLAVDNIKEFLANIVNNFQSFAPLGLVLVTMLGAGVAEKSGFMETLMKVSVYNVPKKWVTVTVVFIAILANAAADAGFIVLPPLAALVYLGVGRHPLLGMFTAYAALAAGFCANIMVNMLDVLVAGFTEPAAQMIDPNYVVNPSMNLYFLIVSAIILTVVATFVSEKYVAPRFGEYEGEVVSDSSTEVTTEERKALKASLLSLLVLVVILVALCIGDNAFMKDPATGSILSGGSTLMRGIVPIITIIFLVPGFVYGKVCGKIKNDKDLVALMNTSMSDMGSYIVLAFAAGQFLYLFNTSNLGTLMSIKGAELLANIGFTGTSLIVAFVFFAAFINLFVGSSSAKWAIMAPVFVPMFLLLGYDPALTQLAYRIGDSVTNPISPLFPYFPILIAFAKRYDKNIGMGTIISSVLPYCLAFLIMWLVLLVIFITFNLPLGPGGAIFYSM